jgi:hypothetical protein
VATGLGVDATLSNGVIMNQLQQLIEELVALEKQGYTEVRVTNPSATQMCNIFTSPIVTSEKFERVSILERGLNNEPKRIWVKQVRINPSYL